MDSPASRGPVGGGTDGSKTFYFPDGMHVFLLPSNWVVVKWWVGKGRTVALGTTGGAVGVSSVAPVVEIRVGWGGVWGIPN